MNPINVIAPSASFVCHVPNQKPSFDIIDNGNGRNLATPLHAVEATHLNAETCDSGPQPQVPSVYNIASNQPHMSHENSDTSVYHRNPEFQQYAKSQTFHFKTAGEAGLPTDDNAMIPEGVVPAWRHNLQMAFDYDPSMSMLCQPPSASDAVVHAAAFAPPYEDYTCVTDFQINPQFVPQYQHLQAAAMGLSGIAEDEAVSVAPFAYDSWFAGPDFSSKSRPATARMTRRRRSLKRANSIADGFFKSSTQSSGRRTTASSGDDGRGADDTVPTVVHLGRPQGFKGLELYCPPQAAVATTKQDQILDNEALQSVDIDSIANSCPNFRHTRADYHGYGIGNGDTPYENPCSGTTGLLGEPMCYLDKAKREVRVVWNEDCEIKTQKFSCKKLGKEKAFRKAHQIMSQLAVTRSSEFLPKPKRLRLADIITYTYDGPFSPRLIFRKRTREWIVEWHQDGVMRSNRWSCKKLGKEEAVMRAEHFVNNLSLGIDPASINTTRHVTSWNHGDVFKRQNRKIVCAESPNTQFDACAQGIVPEEDTCWFFENAFVYGQFGKSTGDLRSPPNGIYDPIEGNIPSKSVPGLLLGFEKD